MASPAFAETSVERASVIDTDTIRLDGPAASEQRCDDAIEADYRCGVVTEWAVTERVSIKSEALYLRSQDDSLRRTGQISGSGDTKRFEHDDSAWVGRIGVNVKLDGKAQPAH
jgi:hypothetical protein